MQQISQLFQSADWRSEKHVPLIEAPEETEKGTMLDVKVTIGKEIAHPNKTDHHIAWIELYFHPEGAKYPFQIGKAEFLAHGATINGPDTGSVYTHHGATLSFKTDKPGTLLASSYCNIHGLWQNSKALNVRQTMPA